MREPFDISGETLKPALEERSAREMETWWTRLAEAGRARKAGAARQQALSPGDIEALAVQVYQEVQETALDQGVRLPESFLLRLIGELSGLGPLLEWVARPDVEDIAINLRHAYAYTSAGGWQALGPAPAGVGEALRVLIDRAGQRAPTPDLPIADAMLQVVLPTPSGPERKGVRVSYLMPPASPYGDCITLRLSRYGAPGSSGGDLAALCAGRLPPVERPFFAPLQLPAGRGVLSPAAANYLLAVMAQGGTLVMAGATGSGKTYVARRILQAMLDIFPPGSLRLFLVEDSHEIVLNGWNGDPTSDTGNVVYTVTRGEVRGGPPPVSMYDLIRAALRVRPHGIVIGEARGAEAWELVRAAATGHGHSAFTIHATGAEHVWPRFLQLVQSHPDAQRLGDFQIAQGFAEAVTAIAYLERHPVYGQVVREIVEVSPVVERAAARPSFSPLFRFNPEWDGLVPTGNRPARPGFRAAELNLPEMFFRATVNG